MDGANGAIELEDGVISRNGYTVIDDSERMVLTDDGWFDVRREGVKDVYFFGYGHAYLEFLHMVSTYRKETIDFIKPFSTLTHISSFA